jgi:hypothetical protein
MDEKLEAFLELVACKRQLLEQRTHELQAQFWRALRRARELKVSAWAIALEFARIDAAYG